MHPDLAPSPAAPPDLVDGLRTVGREFHARGWSLGTSSNYSVVLGRDPLQLLVTASGKDKSALGRDDFVRVDATGRPVTTLDQPLGRKSSAETLLHCVLAEMIPWVGAVLHTHSVWGTMLSGADLARGSVRLEGYEMLKGLEGIGTHETCEEVPVFANSQDMPELAGRIRARLGGLDWSDPARQPCHGFLLARHGLYTWGRTLADARRQIEIFEFLFETVGRTRSLG